MRGGGNGGGERSERSEGHLKVAAMLGRDVEDGECLTASFLCKFRACLLKCDEKVPGKFFAMVEFHASVINKVRFLSQRRGIAALDVSCLLITSPELVSRHS
jgi:hypothetical protein